MTRDHVQRDADTGGGHTERSDVNIKAILTFLAVLLAVGIVVHVAVWLLYLFFAGQQSRGGEPRYPLASGYENQLPPAPRLQTNPRQDLRDLRAQEDAILDSYGWVDKNAGIVRIPIDEAMRLTLERGLPSRPSGSTPTATSSGDANSGRKVGELKQ